MRTHPRRLAVALLLCLAPALGRHTSYAQPAPDPTLQAAHARFAEGVQFFDKGQYENARAAFLQAYALHKHPAVLVNLAQSSLRSGHTLDADRYFTRYIRESPSLTPAQRADAEKGLAEARAKLGRVDVLAPAGTAVTVDGELAGTDGSTTIDVEPGTHSVKGGTETTSVTVAAGQTVMVRLGKSAAVPAIPAPPPVVPVPSNEEPPPPPPPPAVESVPASSSSIFSRPSTMAPVWTGVGVSFVGFAGAIMFGVFKGNAVDAYNGEVMQIKAAVFNSNGACVNPKGALVGGCNALTSDANQVSADATLANVGVAVGFIGAGFALGWYLFAPKADAKPATTALHHPYVVPIIAPRTGGASLGFDF